MHTGVPAGRWALMLALLLSAPAHTDEARPLGVPNAAAAPGASLTAPQASPEPMALDQLLARAGEYVTRFEVAFSNVVAEERYVQEATETRVVVAAPSPRGFGGGSPVATEVVRRELRSDFLLVKLPGHDQWVPFRDVFAVDKRPVRDRDDRLTRLFLNPAPSAIDQAQKIMAESARYNIGNIERTINLPVFALEVLQPSVQSRFRFSDGKVDTTAGAEMHTVDFQEVGGPTMVRGLAGVELFIHGRLWIEARTGRVVKTEFIVDEPSVRATVTTSYRSDPVFAVDVPVEMREEYVLPNGSRVRGVATYERFRRFEVQVDENIESPTSPF